tara:strand:- start:1002 stop:1439 length:438 start_codon:yes stop_codon:yes gene_type:complete
MIKPSKVIGVNYLERWHVIPRNRFFNIYLHHFIGSDDDRALHDHPFASVSFLLKGHLLEIYESSQWTLHGEKLPFEDTRVVPRFWPVFRWAKHKHRLILDGGPAWTLFITGPRFRKDWYFWCKSGPVHYSLMTTPDGKQIGGCDD